MEKFIFINIYHKYITIEIIANTKEEAKLLLESIVKHPILYTLK